MKTIATTSIIGLLVLNASVACQNGFSELSNKFEVVRFSQADRKIAWSYTTGDANLGDDCVITNLMTEPFELSGVRVGHGGYWRSRTPDVILFAVNPKWTATLHDKTTGKETAVSISDGANKTVHFGAKDWFVVDIRQYAREVVVRPINENRLFILHGVSSNSVRDPEGQARGQP